MSILSHALGRIKPSSTVAITARAIELKAQGADIISLSVGEPDFDTPQHIKDAAIAAIEAGKTKYTAPDGMIELKQAICRKFARENDLAYEPTQISVSGGGKQVIYNALMASVNPGDEVIIPAPYWVSYPDMVLLAGGTPVVVPAGPEDGYKLTPEALAASITPQTKWLIFNAPSNPTGAAYTRDELLALADVLRAHPHVWVMCDDIYEHLIYDELEFYTLPQLRPELQARCLIINGVSKGYAMTGWRIGYGAGPADLITGMRKIQGQSTSNPCTISQWAALAALDGPQDFIAQNNAAFARRRDFVVGALNAIPGITCPTPQGAFYAYPSIAGLIGRTSAGGRRINTDEDFATALLDETGVAVVFGAAFGVSPAFRFSYATSDDILAQACQRIADFCAGLRE
jgi:aspartate aminotransferase